MCRRCPFFDGLFHGRSGGKWLSSRRDNLVEDTITIDLKDIDPTVFDFVLRHAYADTEEELFDEVRSESLNDFIDLVLDVMSAANELMMDRLAQICQKMLGRFVNTRNVCDLLNAVAPCTVTEFKDAALEYICLNLEVMLENKLLDDLDEDLLGELDQVCQENQLACYPVSRSRNSEDFVFEKYPELVSLVEQDRQRRIDSMRLRSRLYQDEPYEEKFRAGNVDKTPASPLSQKAKPTKETNLAADSPVLKSKQSAGDLMFQMDDDGVSSPGPSQKGKGTTRAVSSGDPSGDRQFLEPQSPAVQTTVAQGESLGERGDLDERMGSASDAVVAESPSESRAKAEQGTKPISPLPEKTASKAPWSSTVISSSKKTLKEIMAEASQSRVSNLTLGMSARREASAGGSFAQKLSQRERKKLQQQQMQEKLAAQQNAKAKPQSPWQIPTPQKAPSKPEPSANNDGRQSQSPDPTKATQKPAMTLRQTVAGTSPAARSKPGSTPSQIQSRSVSAPLPTPPRPAKPVQTTPGPVPSPSLSTPSRPIIQSIRHSPRPEPSKSSFFNSPSSGPLPLASILLKQQAEKDELREAATVKHSLHDIKNKIDEIVQAL